MEKRIFYRVFCLLFVALLPACSRALLEEPLPADEMPAEDPASVIREFDWETTPVHIQARCDGDQTKASVSGSKVYWEATDEVGVFDNLNPSMHRFRVTPDAEEPNKAFLDGSVTTGSERWYAVYPSSAIASMSDARCQVTLPAVQYLDNTTGIDSRSMVSIAYTLAEDGHLQFHNIFSLLRFQLGDSGITHIQIIGNTGSALAGTADIDPTSGSITSLMNPQTELHLFPPEGTTYFSTGKDYYAALLPYDPMVEGTTRLVGLTIIMYKGDETSSSTPYLVKRTDNTLTVTRSQGVPLGTITTGTGAGSGTLDEAFFAGDLYKNSSMLTFRFPGASTWSKYRLALYKDAACTELQVAYNLSTNSGWNDTAPCFCFAGLEPNTQYWFRGINLGTGQPTQVATAKTDAFSVKTLPLTASPGEVVLAEDFSELCWFSCCDGVNPSGVSARGVYSESSQSTINTIPMAPHTGEVKADDPHAHFFNVGVESIVFGRLDISTTRLAQWAQYSELQHSTDIAGRDCPIRSRAGLLKVGAEYYTGGIVTPPLDFIPKGCKATIKVKVRARQYYDRNEKEKYMAVSSVSGRVGNATGSYYNTDQAFFKDQTLSSRHQFTLKNDWDDYECEVDAYSGCRILIEADRDAAGTSQGTQCRLFIDDITLTYKAVSSVVTSDITFEKVSFTEATVKWTGESGHTYTIYKDGEDAGSVTAAGTACSYRLTGLSNASTYQIEVKEGAVSIGTGTLMTAALWQNTNNTGQRFISFTWDSMGRDKTTGKNQAYQVQVSTEAGEGGIVYDFVPQPGQACDLTYLFENSNAFGWGYQKDGTTYADQYVGWGGVLNHDYYLVPTGVAVGGLEPNTNYYVRVRTRASATYDRYLSKGSKTDSQEVKHGFGNSEWSDWVAMKTDAPRDAVPDDELLYCGFEDFCAQQDYANRVAGSVPYVFEKSNDLEDAHLRVADLDAAWDSLCFYTNNRPGNTLANFNLADNSITSYLGGLSGRRGIASSEVRTVNNSVIGDFGNWYCSKSCSPKMGQMMVVPYNATSTSFVGTPALTDALLGDKKLSADGTACVFSFHAVALANTDSDMTFRSNLDVKVYRAEKEAWTTVGRVTPAQLRPWGDAGVSDNDYYRYDYSKRPGKLFSFPITLYPGDAVCLYHSSPSTTYGVLVDDLRLTKVVIPTGRNAPGTEDLATVTFSW